MRREESFAKVSVKETIALARFEDATTHLIFRRHPCGLSFFRRAVLSVRPGEIDFYSALCQQIDEQFQTLLHFVNDANKMEFLENRVRDFIRIQAVTIPIGEAGLGHGTGITEETGLWRNILVGSNLGQTPPGQFSEGKFRRFLRPKSPHLRRKGGEIASNMFQLGNQSVLGFPQESDEESRPAAKLHREAAQVMRANRI